MEIFIEYRDKWNVDVITQSEASSLEWYTRTILENGEKRKIEDHIKGTLKGVTYYKYPDETHQQLIDLRSQLLLLK